MKITKLVFLMFLMLPAVASFAQNKTTGWAGKWRGTLVNFPGRPDAKPVEVTMELGDIPTQDKSCVMWRTIYSEAGVLKQTKDYRLCRGTGADDLYVDEGDGVKLTTRLLGDTLVSPFKYDNLLLLSTQRLRGDVMEIDIFTADDKPAIKGVVALTPRSIQRLELRRVSARTK